MFDGEMRYIAVSDRFAIDYELPPKNLIGLSHYDVFPEIPERWKEIHRRCLAGAIEKCDKDPFPRADGRLDWVRWEIHPWYKTKGEIGGIILFSEVITDQVLAEEALRKSEERFRSIVEQLVDGIAVTDEQGRITVWNKSLERITGLLAKNMSGKLIWDFEFEILPKNQQTPERYEQLRNNVLELLRRGAASWAGKWMQREYISPTGTPKILEGVVFPIGTAHGFMLASITRDITERKKMESALTEQMHRMQQLLKTTLDGYILSDIQGQIVDVNPAYCRMVGYTRKELLKMNLREVQVSSFPEETDKLAEQKRFRKGARFESKHRCKDGRIIDNGVGIAPEHLEKIFNIFQRLHSRDTHPGTGIGLAIVKKAVSLMGGKVGVKSELGRGSEFWVKLPATRKSDK
ncbi:MAG: hypothetical protein Kow0042_28730 [Calditrichia bacterium]